MAGGKGKSIGGKATGAKDSSAKPQKSHSAKAGLQVSAFSPCLRSQEMSTRATLSWTSDLLRSSIAQCAQWEMSCYAAATPQRSYTCFCACRCLRDSLYLVFLRKLTQIDLVPLRPCQEILEEQHPEQDARWCQRYESKATPI